MAIQMGESKSLKGGRPKTPRVKIKNAIFIIKQYYLRQKRDNESYTLKHLAKGLNVKYGTLKYWLYKNDMPSVEAWENFKKYKTAQTLIEDIGEDTDVKDYVLMYVDIKDTRICDCGCGELFNYVQPNHHFKRGHYRRKK